ncbi:MAG: hypothetical protein HFH59_03445 [Lachnospiraceae bacterium]|nr:hypothetical protein [Lachnospiraceae bacterium]
MDEKLRQLRKECLKLSYICQDGNLQSAFSCMEIIWSLYNGVMNWTPASAADENRDYFIVSKGQATLALYAVLIEKGMFSENEFADMGSFDSRYCIQTDPTKFPEGGIENAAGSLGHGLPFAVGLAMSAKIKKKQSRIFVLTGDGEFCEGTMWESCLFAAGKKLDNLCVVIDDNHSAGSMIDMGNMRLKLESFGFDVYEVDGHKTDDLQEAFLKSEKNGRPKVVIASTVRGYGSRTLIDEDVWFHKAPNAEELERLCREVDEF